MIAKEMEQIDEGVWDGGLSSQDNPSPQAPVFPVEERYMYRYNRLTLRGLPFLAKRSCKSCHGTGKYGRRLDPQTKQWHTVFCTCLIQAEEAEDATQKEG